MKGKIAFFSKDFLKREPKFYPYVYVCSDMDRPTSISAAAWSGGTTKKIILAEGDILSDVQGEIRNYLQKYKGLVRSKTEGTLLGLDAEVIGERTGDFWPARMAIQKTMDFGSGL